MSLQSAGGAEARADIARQSAVIAALAATVATNGLANVLPLNGRTTGEISGQFPIPLTPPGYVFGVWSLIYTGLLGYAIYQALPAQRDNPRLRRAAWPFLIGSAANIAWILLWHYGYYRLTLAAMLALLASLVLIDRALGDGERPLAEQALARQPFSIYLGWICVATLINVAVALYSAGWRGDDGQREALTAVLLVVGALLGALLGPARRDAALPLVLAWAFAGVAQKQAGSPLLAPTAWAAVAVSIASAAAGLWRARRR